MIGGFLLNRCVATIGDTQIDTDQWKRFINYAIEMGSGAMIHMPSYIKTGSNFQKSKGWIHKHTDSVGIS
jgi:hypothetical protein